jgi:hypothetical protein
MLNTPMSTQVKLDERNLPFSPESFDFVSPIKRLRVTVFVVRQKRIETHTPFRALKCLTFSPENFVLWSAD